MTTDTTLFGIGAVPLIAALIQMLKTTGMPARLAPAAALILGIGTGALSVWQTAQPAGSDAPWAQGIVLGLTWGLAASGLYQGGKLAVGAMKTPPPPPPSSPPPAFVTEPRPKPASQPASPPASAPVTAPAAR